MQSTRNYNFNLLEDSDVNDPTQFTKNFEIIDRELKKSQGFNNKASGTTININDSAEEKIQGMTVTPTEAITSVDITVCGKNLSNVNAYSIGTGWNGTTGLTERASKVYKIPLNTPLYLSAKWSKLTSIGVGFCSDFNRTNAQFVNTMTDNYVINNTDATRQYLIIEPRKANIKSEDLVNACIQLEYNKTTDYEQYKEQTATIDTTTQTGWEELSTYYPTTNIIPTQPANIDVEYVADLKNYIDNKFKALEG